MISPFLSTYIFHNLPPDFNKILDDKIIGQLLITFGAIISFWIGNRALESFKKSQEQKKIAKILIASMEAHFVHLEKVAIKAEINKSEREALESIFNQIKKDHIYESALKLMGIFEIKYIDIISTYSRSLNSVTDNILNSYRRISDNESQPYQVSGNSHYLEDSLNMLTISALLNIMILSREILQDKDKFNKYKNQVKIEYTSQKRAWEDWKEACKKYVDRDRDYDAYPIPPVLEKTEILFKQYDLLAELED